MALLPLVEQGAPPPPPGSSWRTARWVTPFELARVRGVRAHMLCTGNAPRVSQAVITAIEEKTPYRVADPVDVATAEVAFGALPLVAVERTLPDGTKEIIPLNQLRVPDEQHLGWMPIV